MRLGVAVSLVFLPPWKWEAPDCLRDLIGNLLQPLFSFGWLVYKSDQWLFGGCHKLPSQLHCGQEWLLALIWGYDKRIGEKNKTGSVHAVHSGFHTLLLFSGRERKNPSTSSSTEQSINLLLWFQSGVKVWWLFLGGGNCFPSLSFPLIILFCYGGGIWDRDVLPKGRITFKL